jgi:undecaprenyl-phosphate 4-deoxy-4-formamido-L-arabinose transferase
MSSPPSGASSEPAREAGASPQLSAVVPVFNEQDCLPGLHARLVAALEATARPWEIVYVDDGSTDRSAALLSGFAGADARVRVVEFNRNYGQHAAVFAGLARSSGDVVVTLDADLQNPPEEIGRLVAAMDEGYDVVGTRRRGRKDPLFRRLASRLVNRLTGGGMSDYGCMLRAYRRSVVDEIGKCQELSSFIPVLANLFAGRVTEIEVAHEERAHGTSKYGLAKLLSLQFDLMTGFSTWPLRLMTYFGGLVAVGAFALAAFIFAKRLLPGGDQWGQFGVFTLFALLFLMLGLLFVGLGLVGEYVGRIYGEVRGRPRYVVRRCSAGGARS